MIQKFNVGASCSRPLNSKFKIQNSRFNVQCRGEPMCSPNNNSCSRGFVIRVSIKNKRRTKRELRIALWLDAVMKTLAS